MRKYFIDNLRSISILLLFPFHTCMIYNNWGELFYVTNTPNDFASMFVGGVYPWWMTLLFTLSGISSYYALQKRTNKEYVNNRMYKLLIPLVFGLLLIIPVQSYIADIFYNNYTGGYFNHYKIFFTKFTYLTGQDGGFTPGHLWFMLYLFIVSLIMLPFMSKYIKSDIKINYDKISITILLSLMIIVTICTPILNISGKSIGESLACFATGFFVLSNDTVQEKLEKHFVLLLSVFISVMAIYLLIRWFSTENDIAFLVINRIYMWTGILTMLSIGRKYLNRTNKILSYLSSASFPLYYFHQSFLVIIAFFCVKYINIIWLQFVMIMLGSFIASLICYEICKRFKATSFMFGIKKHSRKTKA